MNGDLQTIYTEIKNNGNRITVLETKSEERHRVNHEDIRWLKKELSAFKTLLVDSDLQRTQEIDSLKNSIKVHWFIIGTILVGLLGVVWSNFK